MNRAYRPAVTWLLGCALVVGLFYRQEQTINRVENVVAQRDIDLMQARYGSCVQFNVSQLELRDAFKRNTRELVGAATEGGSADRATIDAYVARQDRAADESFPYRDCSPKGIEKWLTNPPADPNAPAPTREAA